MNSLKEILLLLGDYIQRNWLMIFIISLLVLCAPSLLQGFAFMILYFILGIFLLLIGVGIYFRWKIRSMQKEMERKMPGGGFGAQGGNFRGFYHFGGMRGFGGQSQNTSAEGHVTVEQTQPQKPQKMEDSDGTFVDFEETKDNQ